MGYVNPNVVKEIYLPVHTSDQNISLEVYKEKYGIDLHDIFEFKLKEVNAFIPVLKQMNVKLYFVFEDDAGAGYTESNGKVGMLYTNTETDVDYSFELYLSLDSTFEPLDRFTIVINKDYGWSVSEN